MFQDVPTFLQQRRYFASADWKREVVENAPIMQPVYDLWHFLSQKYTFSVYRIPSEDADSLLRDPLPDVLKYRLPNGVAGMR